MQSRGRFQSSIVSAISCAAIILMAALAVLPAWAQNSVPPTAVQAARMPQFAQRLAHPGQAASPANVSRAVRPSKLGASRRSALQACSQKQARWLRDDDYIYSNGPTNGTTDAWTINFGFVTSDSFPGGAITSATFAMWLTEGDTLETVQLSITSGENGGTSYFNQTVTFTQSDCSANQYSYDVCTEATTFNGPALSAGTYWLNLQNAVTADGGPVYWDENSGPSSASQNEVGTIPSESFTLLGNGGDICMPEQSGGFKVIHDFSGEGDGASPSGVAVDRAGNLYGPTQGGSAGTVFKLARAGTGWLLSTLYNFLGGNSGGSPAGVIVGPNGIPYGSAAGGIQNCTSGGYCGLIFGLRPLPNICPSTSCYWTENVLYRFTGSTDAWQGGGLVSDQAGNLYGVSYSGGAHQQGAVFELSPSMGGWEESILYNFTGGSDGGSPTTLLFGNDGNLYGMTGLGGTNGGGVVFQLTPSGSGWTEAVLYDIPSAVLGTSPGSLLQDSSGNLFGTYDYDGCCASSVGLIFMLSPSNGNWVFTELHHGNANLDGDDVFPNMALDAAGNLWGTETAYSGCFNTVNYGYIFELTRGSGWQYSTPEAWDHTYFPTGGALGWDAHGNLYGTTSICGTNNQGTVWEFSP